jgi:alpha-D-xyloside xylohydrolase
VPLGSEVQSAQQPQSIFSVRVYPGADGSFTLFRDDGTIYGYEHHGGSVTRLTWNEAAQHLTYEGAPRWSGPETSVVTVVGK